MSVWRAISRCIMATTKKACECVEAKMTKVGGLTVFVDLIIRIRDRRHKVCCEILVPLFITVSSRLAFLSCQTEQNIPDDIVSILPTVSDTCCGDRL